MTDAHAIPGPFHRTADDAAAPAAPQTQSRAESRVLSTLNQDGSRRWICPRPSPGRYQRARRIVAYTLIAIFTLIPYLKIGGKPMVLLDLATRRFTILGRTFLPTDTLLLALLLIGAFLAIFLITALFGRVWCGWACPQTVYLEFIFRPIERLFEGTPGRVKKSRFAASGAGKLLKHAAYLLVSLYLAHTFLAYFVGVEQLAQWIRRSPLEHPASFAVMAAVTGLMLFDFGYFREQTCIVACPYGRFQSTLLDRSSLIISYDRTRGEPRGKARRANTPAPANAIPLPQLAPAAIATLPSTAPATAPSVGDCVDCRMCVTTCPTGIDIRDGLQMECIGCAQCIDACDAVMTKLDRPTGLIRYSSQAAMAGEKTRLLRPRIIIYPAVITAIAVIFTAVLLNQATADVTVLRGLGAPFTQLPTGEIANPIRLKITNRTDAPAAYRFDAAAQSGTTGIRIIAEEDPVLVPPGQSRTVPALIAAPAAAFTRGALAVSIRITDDAAFSTTAPYRLMGPASARSSEPKHHDDRDHEHDDHATREATHK